MSGARPARPPHPRGVKRGFVPPWIDRQRRFSWLKALVLAGAFLPAAFIVFWWTTGQLGALPVNAALHLSGIWTVRFVLLALAVTPARAVFDRSRVVLVRRMLGVTAMVYALGHFSLFVVDQNFVLPTVALEIVKRIYLTIGFTALLGLVALGTTSTDAMVRRMGRGWKRLHRLIYPIAVLMLTHHFLQAKVNVSTAVFAAGLFVWLILWRVLPVWARVRPVALAGLGVLAGVLAAGIEFGWYGLATRIDPWRVLMANLDISHGLRPALWVGIAGLAVAGLAVPLRPGGMRAGWLGINTIFRKISLTRAGGRS
jgi:sulfoxide reductase heme-binding subunit YedZ